MGRLLKLVIFVGAIAGLVIVGKKLMGGLGPEPGSAMAPKEWPSLVPEPPTGTTPSANGSTSTEPAEADATSE